MKLGQQRIEGAHRQARHRHRFPYAAVVMAGRYEEAGEFGRWRVTQGDVLLHDAFDAHCNRFETGRVDVLNIPLSSEVPIPFAAGTCSRLDELLRLVECRDAIAASAFLLDSTNPRSSSCMDWPDELAAELARSGSIGLSRWAKVHGIRQETVSRGFARLYGLTPARFRVEAKARRAWRMVLNGPLSLSEIAFAAGFSDQSHMSRGIVSITGATPGYWRRSNLFKTAEAPRRSWRE